MLGFRGRTVVVLGCPVLPSVLFGVLGPVLPGPCTAQSVDDAPCYLAGPRKEHHVA